MSYHRHIRLIQDPGADRAMDHLRRWDQLLEALEKGEIRQVGWGNASPDVIFILPEAPSVPERQLLYRIAESLKVPCYYTISCETLEKELSFLPSMSRRVVVGVEIPTLAQMSAEGEGAAYKKQAWLVLREKARPVEDF